MTSLSNMEYIIIAGVIIGILSWIAWATRDKDESFFDGEFNDLFED